MPDASNFWRWRQQPKTLEPEQLVALKREEEIIETELAKPNLTWQRKLHLRNRLDANFTLQRESFFEEVHPAHAPEYVERFRPEPGESWRRTWDRAREHPGFNRVIMPVLLISPPVFFRIYPMFATYRHRYFRAYSKAQLRRRKTVWRRSILAEGYQAKGPVERFSGRAIVGVTLMLFAKRMFDQYMLLAEIESPMTIPNL